jgi:hypothetical protein
LKRVALNYQEHGLSVVPANIKQKMPALDTWKEYQQRRPTAEEITNWFSHKRDLGIITGKVSDNTEIIDFDADPERPLVFQQWRMIIESEAPELFARLYVESTQNDGQHVIYRCPEVKIPGNLKLAKRKVGEKKEKTLIETRGEGGFCIVSPSKGYKTRQGSFADLPVITKEERDILISAAQLLNEHIEVKERVNGSLSRAQNRTDGLSPGDDFNERGDSVALLIKHGWQPARRNGCYQYLRRPGKNRGHSASLIDGKTFYVFSSNAYPFESERGYSPFAVYALLEHGGVYSEAAKSLAREGYGDPIIQRCKKDLEFPSQVMSGVAGDFANLHSSYLEVPAHFFYMAFLTCLGSVVANSLTLASEIAPQPRLFLLLLGESADDRKSTALNKVVDFFKWCVEDFSVCWGVGSAEGLQQRLQDKNRLLLCFDEFKQFVSKCKIEASVLLPCVNTLFESNRYEARTKKTNIYLDDVYLTLMAASTLDTYENTWSSQFTDIGFNNRLFLVPGSGERKHSFPIKRYRTKINTCSNSN